MHPGDIVGHEFMGALYILELADCLDPGRHVPEP
jgi:hypothetical protein